MDNKTCLFWFRQDLRLSDNPGLSAASKYGTVIPVYILDNTAPKQFTLGGASKWWLHHSLSDLNNSLDKKLNRYHGNPDALLCEIIKKHKVSAVFWNTCYEPWQLKRDKKIKKTLDSLGVEGRTFNASLLWEPWEVLKKDGTPYKVFTPFYQRGCLNAPAPSAPLSKPRKLRLKKDPGSCALKALNLLPTQSWGKKLEAHWHVGEAAARKKLTLFLNKQLSGYTQNRDYPHQAGTSQLSPYLHFGEISPRQIWHATHLKAGAHRQESAGFLRQLAWREFSYYLLYHFPTLPIKNFQAKFDRFQWKHRARDLNAWQKGQTGIPLVDAGMRELWQTGYMHNRVRMVVASFLIKNLLIHWRRGEDWFWDCLVDADLANNSASWQWVAGSGADAAPFFRIFNPVRQGEKFDPDGEYTRRFVPELTPLPNKYLFKPWEAPEAVLAECGIVLGKTYPKPIVDLDASRKQALAIYRAAVR